MGYFPKFPQNSVSIIIRSKLHTLLGTIVCLIFISFIILSIPVYIFRFIVAQVAKIVRPDLGDILNGQSSIFANDYFAGTHPRSNIVTVLHCEGLITFEEAKNEIMARWAQAREQSIGRFLYDKLQQYPVKWLGFAFWKKAYGTFSIDNHLFKHSGTDTLCTEDEMTNLVEKLVNTRFSKGKSPWEFHLIENYQRPLLKDEKRKEGEQHSIVIFKTHHCLADGFGIVKILLEGLLGIPVSEMKRPVVRDMKRSLLESFLFWISVPVTFIAEMSYMFSHSFRNNYWEIVDNDKRWSQFYTRSELISINCIKEIKNTFGVSFASVVLSLISGAVQKSRKTNTKMINNEESESWPYLNVLPAIGSDFNRESLANHFTAAVFDVPSDNFPSPLERLQAIHQALENSRKSVVPLMFQIFSTVIGAHLSCVNDVLSKNRQVPIVLTNFVVLPDDALASRGRKLIEIESVVGGLSENFGVVLTAISHNRNIRINVIAGGAIMTQTEANQFTKYIDEEMKDLQELLLMKKKLKKRNFH